MNQNGIVEGLIIGVGAGLVLSLYAEIQKRIARCEQIKFIRKYLISKFTKIANPGLEEHLPADKGNISPMENQVRFFLLENFLRELQAITEHRTAAMSGAQVADLHRVLSDAKTVHDRVSKLNDYPRGLELYRGLYKEFSKLKWLGIPEEIPGVRDSPKTDPLKK